MWIVFNQIYDPDAFVKLLSAPLLVQNEKIIGQARGTIEVLNTFRSNIIGNFTISE